MPIIDLSKDLCMLLTITAVGVLVGAFTGLKNPGGKENPVAQTIWTIVDIAWVLLSVFVIYSKRPPKSPIQTFKFVQRQRKAAAYQFGCWDR